MKELRLLKAMNDIDDEFIMQGDEPKKSRIPKRSMAFRICAAAACFALIGTGGVLMHQKLSIKSSPKSEGSNITSSIITENNDTRGKKQTEEEITDHVSENGAEITYYSSINADVIDGVKKYITENGIDSNKTSFVFLNSRYTYSPEYICKNVLDMYSPAECDEAFDLKSEDYRYYVSEYYIADETRILTGYMTADEKGNIVESKGIMSPDECSSVTIKTDTDDAVQTALDYMGLKKGQITDISGMFYYPDGNAKYSVMVTCGNGRTTAVDPETSEIVYSTISNESSVSETEEAVSENKNDSAVTDSETAVNEIKEVSRVLTEWKQSEEYQSLSQTEKLDRSYDLLLELARNGTEKYPYSLIDESSITCSSNGSSISYIMSNGTHCVFSLDDNSRKTR